MTSLVKQLAYGAAEPLERLVSKFLKTAVLVIFGLSCLITSLALFTVALYEYLHTVAGPELAATSVAGLYVVCALVSFLLAKMQDANEKATQQANEKAQALPFVAEDATASAMQSRQSNKFSRQIDGIVAPIHDALHEAGLERERAMFLAGAAIAKELTPLAAVAVTFVFGVMVGRTMRGFQ